MSGAIRYGSKYKLLSFRVSQELEEEAGLRLEQESDLRSAGSVSFLHQSERGLHPQTEFVFDLRLPPEFRPENRDGEVEDWRLVPATQLISLLRSQVVTST
jgi:8-oxo-dGTP pyrophosphatase MutT (NUDIX family)